MPSILTGGTQYSLAPTTGSGISLSTTGFTTTSMWTYVGSSKSAESLSLSRSLAPF